MNYRETESFVILLNIYILVMIIICLHNNYLTGVMNQFDLELKKLFPVIYDTQSSMRVRSV